MSSKISLRDYTRTKSEAIPEGWKTTKQWAEHEGISMTHTGTIINRLVAEGTWEMKKFLIAYASFTRPVPHYRPKDKAKA